MNLYLKAIKDEHIRLYRLGYSAKSIKEMLKQRFRKGILEPQTSNWKAAAKALLKGDGK